MYSVLTPICLTNGCTTHRKLFYIIHAENSYQIYRGCTKICGPGLTDITFNMLNLDALKAVLSTACTFKTKSSYWYDPHRCKDCESSSQENMPLEQCWGCIYWWPLWNGYGLNSGLQSLYYHPVNDLFPSIMYWNDDWYALQYKVGIVQFAVIEYFLCIFME